jgi:glutamate-5-semialdehyde dehydrogenase
MEIENILKGAKKASKIIGSLSNDKRNDILDLIAVSLIENIDNILQANSLDVVKKTQDDPMRDRLLLSKSRIEGLAEGIKQLIALSPPDRKVVSSQIKENGLQIDKILVPLGVVASIYESRPNVTIDIAAICIKSGNAAVLRGGSDAWNTNKCFENIIHDVLDRLGLPREIVVFYPIEREHMLPLLKAVKYIDIIIPRGSAALIQFVKENSLVPSIETGAGVCHTYISKYADLEKAASIVINAKTTRPSVCNSLDTIIVDREVLVTFLHLVKDGLQSWNVEIYADKDSYPVLKEVGYPILNKADHTTFMTEFLSYKCNLKTVDGIDEALDHIEKYSTKHSEAIISEDKGEIEKFLYSVDSASVYANASTRFTDGFEFGLGAEIGISTQKLHARGPFALEKLVTEKWIGIGTGQIRI